AQNPLLKESEKQSNWTLVKDALITKLKGAGIKWDNIAKRVPGRSSLTCHL
ncbi:hypothetical protein V2W45_1233984, partial [Cenococcum geophilum]